MHDITRLLGRIFLAAIFLLSGLNKIGNFSGTQEYMASAGMPMTSFFLFGAIALLMFGGFSVLLGLKTAWGAIALMIFLIPATFIFHFDLGNQQEMIHLMKNFAILGGLLTLAASGPGKLSLDAKRGNG